MKTKLILLVVAVLLVIPAAAQTALTATTLSSAINSNQNGIPLTSITNVSVGSILFLEDGTGSKSEAMQVIALPVTGTTVQVLRAYDQTFQNGHLSGTVVLVGPANAFNEVDPSGSCTAAQTPFTPYVNLKSGNQWLCSTVTSSWVPGFFNVDVIPGVTTAVASVAGATNPSGPLFHITGALAITAWGSTTAVGPLGAGGSATSPAGAPFCIIPDAAFTTTATNNIALASTAVINKLLCYTFDQTNKKYIPSY